MAVPEWGEVANFDLSHVDATQRRRAWTDALNQYFYQYDVSFPRAFHNGRLTGRSLGEVRTATITSDPLGVDRTQAHIRHDPRDYYFLLFPTGGAISLGQRGREVSVGAGRFVFVATTESYGYKQADTETFHSLIVPGRLVRARKPDADDQTATDLGGTVMERIFCDYAASFCQNASGLDPQTLLRTTEHLIDMFALVLAAGDVATDETVVQVTHRRRANKLIEQQFHDPEFGFGRLAIQLGISERYVQKIFSASGETVSGAIRARRLAEACRLLEKRNVSRAHISSIAYAVGFTDAAYFSRVFRDQIGVPPSEFSRSGQSQGLLPST